MNKGIKYTLIGIGLLVALIVAGLAIFAATFDPNAYKGRITEEVKKATGRDLSIDGKISVSVFPWVGAEVGGIWLSNAKGFGDKPFVAFKSAQVRIKVLPLLSGSVEVGRIVLDGLDLNLAKNKEGVSNWDDLASGAKEPAPAPAKPAETGKPGMKFEVDGILIKNANIVYEDAKEAKRYALERVNVETGEIAVGKPFKFKISFGLESKDPEVVSMHDLTGTAALDVEKGRYDLKGFKYALDASGKGVPRGKLAAALTAAAIAADLKAQSVKVEGLELAADQVKLAGSAGIAGFAKPAVTFALKSDNVDLDALLGTQKPGEAEQKPAEQQHAAAGPEPDVIPVETIRNLNVDGSLNIGKLKVKGMTMTDVVVKVLAKGGVLTVDPASFGLSGGKVQSATSIDAKGDVPHTAFRLDVQNVQAGPLVKDMTGRDSFSGLVNTKADLTTSGAKVSAMKRGLNGTIQLSVLDGVFPGVNLEDIAKSAATAAVGGGTLQGKSEDRTKFGSITATARATNGVIANNDLEVKAPNIRADGAGTVDLPGDSLNYLAKAWLVTDSRGQGGASSKDTMGLMVPVRLKGSLQKPSWSVDLTEYFKGSASGLVEGAGGLIKGTGEAVGGAVGGAMGGILGTGQKSGATQSGSTQQKSGTTTKQPEKKGVLEGVKKLF